MNEKQKLVEKDEINAIERIVRSARNVWIGRVDLIYLWIRAKCLQR